VSEDDQVRRLLADARHTDPLPPDVAERLDGVLADLRADRPVPPAVSDLAAARRRRRARALLVAAAAVVVAGIAVNQVRTGTSGGDADSASSADSGGAVTERQQDGPEGGVHDGLPLSSDAQAVPFPASGKAPHVDPDGFGAAALRLRDRADRRATFDARREYTVRKGRCAVPDLGAGSVVPIRYDGRPAVLVYRSPRGDTQVVDLYVCGHDRVARSITLPAP
jgi:hypothetical protein